MRSTRFIERQNLVSCHLSSTDKKTNNKQVGEQIIIKVKAIWVKVFQRN